jgi:uncharacterized protein YprB with RNaseH-like and TPR domain
LTKKLRCKHRHTIDEHPACFAQAEVVDRRPLKTPWFEEPGMRMGYLDIESDGLKADFSTMLSWAIKPKGQHKVVTDVITKKDIFDGDIDKRLIESILDEMSKYKIIVTYYGTGFDIPYIRAKALHYGLRFPSFSELYHFDLYYTVKSKLCISRKSLDNACDYLGIEGKTPLDKDTWRAAKYGNKKALEEVLVHNVADVVILEELHDKLADFAKWTRRSI